MLKLFLKAVTEDSSPLPTQAVLAFFSLEIGVALPAPPWEHHALKLGVERFASPSAGFCPPRGPLFPEIVGRSLSQWGGGWGAVYPALSTVAGFAGHLHHCACPEQYVLSKA